MNLYIDGWKIRNKRKIEIAIHKKQQAATVPTPCPYNDTSIYKWKNY